MTSLKPWAGFALLTSLLLTGCISHHVGPMPGEPSKATFVELDGVRVRYEDRGQGPPVVLLHGFASALETWVTVKPALEEEYRLISLDLKGFGWTDRPAGDYSPAAQAKMVYSLLDHLGVDKAMVVAHSWGSSVALAMAMDSPDRVERIALYDAWVFYDQLPLFFILCRADGVGEVLTWLFYKERPAEKMTQAFYDPAVVNEAFAEEVVHAMTRPGTEFGALEAIRGQRYEEVEDGYSKIDTPTLLLWGREDRVTRLHHGERLVNTLPNAQLVVFPQSGHFPMIEARGASNQALVEFLSETTLEEGAAQPGAPEAEEVQP